MLARVETEKRISLIKAWEESEKSKAENKLRASFLEFFFWVQLLLLLFCFMCDFGTFAFIN